MKNLTFFQTAALAVGSVVGAGYLGIPYVVSRVGLPVGLILIVGVGLLVLVQFLGVGEMTLRTSGRHQLVGYVGRYLGENWQKFALFVIVFETYGVLTAFIVAEGQVLAALFGGPAFFYSLLFFAVMSVIVYFGLRLVERVDLLLTLLAGAVVIGLAFMGWSRIRFAEFMQTDWSGLLPAYGVVLFSFLGVAAVPQMRMALFGRERLLLRAIVVGCLIPIALYILFTIAVLGVSGSSVTQIATIGLGQILGPAVMIVGNALAALTMTTAYLGGALALKQTFLYDYHYRHVEAWLLTITVPIALFTFGLHNFIGIISFVGAVLGGLLGIILVLAWWRAVKSGDRQPEYSVSGKKFLGGALVAVFLLGIVYSLIHW